MTFVTENMALLTGRPEHVEALKQYILSLAVRGLLVPQEAGDEPAGEVLKRIRVEKAPFQVPRGWAWVKLEEISKNVHYGYTASADTSIKNVRLLRITDIQNSHVHWDQVPGCQISEREIPKYQLQESDILIARTGGTIGKSYLVKGITVKAVFASYLIRIIPNQKVNPEYLKIFIESPFYWRQLYDAASGTGQPNVNATSLKSLQVPLPPLPEQHRIVAKVASLFSLIDRLSAAVREWEETRRRWLGALLRELGEARSGEEVRMRWGQLSAHFDELIDSVEAVKALRQVILQLAVKGVLVEQDAGEEPAGVGLKQIGPDEAPYEVPEGWVWVRLEEVAEDVSYGTSEKATGDSSMVPILRMGNITSDGFIDYNNLKYVSSDIKDLPRLYLKSGDVVFNRTNSYELVGKSAVYDGPDDIYTFASYLIRFSPSKNLVIPDFINIYLNSKVCRETQIEPEITKQTNQANFNGTKLKNIQFPLPPLSEQRRIVERVERLMGWCDGLEGAIEAREGVMGRVVGAVSRDLG